MTALYAVQVLADALHSELVQEEVLSALLTMASDPVPNIRFNVAKTPRSSRRAWGPVVSAEIAPCLSHLVETDADRDVSTAVRSAHDRGERAGGVSSDFSPRRLKGRCRARLGCSSYDAKRGAPYRGRGQCPRQHACRMTAAAPNATRPPHAASGRCALRRGAVKHPEMPPPAQSFLPRAFSTRHLNLRRARSSRETAL